MTTETGGAGTALVPGTHRAIRVLGADEGPFRGTLVTTGDAVAVMADADGLGGWAGWAYSGREHVAGPLDLVRRSDGHDVLLPWCTETVDAFLGRRAAMGTPLTAGEASTLVVSLLRGVGEVTDAADRGRWWLTDGGRPVFAIGEGEDVREAAAALVDRVQREGSDRALGRLLAAVHDGLTEGRDRPRMSTGQLERWEAELFQIAAPRVLDTALHAPERVRGIELLRETPGRPPASRRAARTAALGSLGGAAIGAKVRTAVADAGERARALGAALTARVGGRARDRVRDGAPDPSSARPRRKIIIAGAAAAAVVVGGVLWPGGATGEAGSSPRPATSSRSTQVPEPGTSAAPRQEKPAEEAQSPVTPGASEDPGAAAGDLLEEITDCLSRDDAECPDAVAEGSVGAVDALADVLAGGSAPTVSLVDSYGDVAVIRVSPGGAGDGAQSADLMLVLVRVNEKWLVRDVYGVADQPG